MKRLLFTLISAILLYGLSMAQYQLENPGFEDWDDILIGSPDTIREPADWSSLKSSDNPNLSALAPVVCTRSTDAHSGSYSLKLTNVMSFIVANGVATNGRVHPNITTSLAYMFTDTLNDEWNTPLIERPDSMVGWFKYEPQDLDTMRIRAILHRGFGKQPDADSLTNWIAQADYNSPLNTGDEWIRFSTPFVYKSETMPQYVLVVLNSGNGYLPAAGSVAYFDDFELIYNTPINSVADPEAPFEYIYAIGNRFIVISNMREVRFNSARVLDVAGRVVWSGSVTSDRIDISKSRLKNGIYMVSLESNGKLYTRKIVLQ